MFVSITSSRRLENMSSRRLQDMSWRRLLDQQMFAGMPVWKIYIATFVMFIVNKPGRRLALERMFRTKTPKSSPTCCFILFHISQWLILLISKQLRSTIYVGSIILGYVKIKHFYLISRKLKNCAISSKLIFSLISLFLFRGTLLWNNLSGDTKESFST